MPETKITDVKVPLPWEKAVKYRRAAKDKAARQFLAIWRANRDRQDSELRWGEEVEYTLVDLGEGGVRAALCADEVLRRLGHATGDADPTCGAGWRTEYGNMMVEGVTHPPFGPDLDDVLKLEPALAWRRRELERIAAELGPSIGVVTLSAFPLLGVPGCTAPAAEPSPDGEVSKSLLCPDEATSPHPRYQTFTANYRKRKGCKVGAFIPREGVRDEERLNPQRIAELPFELARAGSRSRDPVPGHIYMDSQAFGACQCCMQATFLASDLQEARYLTDQFLVLAPLLLALTAATPFLRGLVAETDTRWPTFKQTWDDRCEEEVASVHNSRTSANDLYIGCRLASDPEACKAANDVDVAIDGPAFECLREGGVDELLSRHVAHLLVRDPLMVFEDQMDIDDEQEADHWEQLQGTNWGTVRFKPPPAGGEIGWRVEFRTPEVQITDFENAAIVAVIRVLLGVLREEKWDLVIPVSLSDENDETSGQRDAASKGLFWFPQSLGDAPPEGAKTAGCATKRRLADIVNGHGGVFPRCRAWVDRQHEAGRCSDMARDALRRYFRLFELRAAGALPTPAGVLRARLRAHPGYRGDGVVPVGFVRELCESAVAANRDGADSQGLRSELLGDVAPNS